MASDSPKQSRRQSRYTAERDMPGAFEGETVTRRGLMTGGALAVGGIATAAFAIPSLGFAVAPMLKDSTADTWQDVGAEEDFNETAYVQAVMNITADAGDAGKHTVYVRKRDPKSDKKNADIPYVAISNRCAHLGCPVRYIQASQRFVCPCHGGIYEADGKVAGGPPVRPLDRFYTRVRDGRVEVGDRFSLNSELDRFSPRDPSNHLDGLWQYLYPSRPST